MSSQHEKHVSESTKKLHQRLAKEDSAGDEGQEPSQAEMLEHPSYEELQKKLDDAKTKVSQYWERILRMQADMDNAQRRAERDIASAHKFALEKFILELLPVIDSLERSLIIDAQTSVDTVLEGVKLTLKMFLSALEKFGVEQVNPQSDMFNPELHQAVSVQVQEEAKPGTVLNVLQKGYLLNNRLIRPALVVVAKNNVEIEK